MKIERFIPGTHVSYTDEMNRYYAHWWENPKDIRGIVFQALNDLVRARIPPSQPGARALDIGSGHGTIVSFLVEKGYDVTAVEINEEFVDELHRRFPSVHVIQADIKELNIEEQYDLVTVIELAQNLDHLTLRELLDKLSNKTGRLLINISNRNSLHGVWCQLRKFRAPFVFPYTPVQLNQYLKATGFTIVYSRGVGLLTPVSLLSDFRMKLIPVWFAKIANRLDRYVERFCHLYYAEALGTLAGPKPSELQEEKAQILRGPYEDTTC